MEHRTSAGPLSLRAGDPTQPPAAVSVVGAVVVIGAFTYLLAEAEHEVTPSYTGGAIMPATCPNSVATVSLVILPLAASIATHYNCRAQ